MALTRRLSSCVIDGTRLDQQSFQPITLAISALTVQLSQAYRRDLFRVDAAAEPVPNAGLILAVLVVLPEAAVVMPCLLKRRGPP